MLYNFDNKHNITRHILCQHILCQICYNFFGRGDCMNDLAEKIKALRDLKGWSQEDLAEKLGISRSAVGNYEQGTREPDLETLENLADTFNCTMSYLVEPISELQDEVKVVYEMLNNSLTRDNLIKYAELLRDTVYKSKER